MTSGSPASRSLVTTASLLEGLRDSSNDAVWEAFDQRYRPILYNVARRLGLGDDDAREIVQQVMIEFVRDHREGKYDPARGRLRSWLIGIARHRAIDLLRTRGRRGERRGDSAIVTMPDERALSDVWDDEARRLVYRQAWETLRASPRMEARTIEAFELVALQGVPAEAVAERIGRSVDEVYRIKHRLTARLRELVEQLTAAWEDDGS